MHGYMSGDIICLKMESLQENLQSAFKCVLSYMVTLFSVKALHSSVNILGCIDKCMLAIGVNVEFSMLNGFMYKCMHRQQAIMV